MVSKWFEVGITPQTYNNWTSNEVTIGGDA